MNNIEEAAKDISESLNKILEIARVTAVDDFKKKLKEEIDKEVKKIDKATAKENIDTRLWMSAVRQGLQDAKSLIDNLK
jgi:uncharacterized protein (DUF2164 family)